LQPVSVDVPGLPKMYGALVLSVDVDLPPRLLLQAAAHRVQISGEYKYPVDQISHEADGTITASFSPAAGSRWIFENRGSMVITGSDSGGLRGALFIRSFDYRASRDGVVAMRLGGVPESRVGDGGETLPGEDVSVVVSGRLMGSCTARDENGGVIDDPRHSLNPLCDEILGPL